MALIEKEPWALETSVFRFVSPRQRAGRGRSKEADRGTARSARNTRQFDRADHPLARDVFIYLQDRESQKAGLTMFQRLKPIIIKEFRQIRRNRRVLAILTPSPCC